MTEKLISIQIIKTQGRERWSSGLGANSWFEGRGFESQYHIQDGHFSQWIDVKLALFVSRKDENKRKETRDGQFLIIKS